GHADRYWSAGADRRCSAATRIEPALQSTARRPPQRHKRARRGESGARAASRQDRGNQRSFASPPILPGPIVSTLMTLSRRPHNHTGARGEPPPSMACERSCGRDWPGRGSYGVCELGAAVTLTFTSYSLGRRRLELRTDDVAVLLHLLD